MATLCHLDVNQTDEGSKIRPIKYVKVQKSHLFFLSQPRTIHWTKYFSIVESKGQLISKANFEVFI